MSNLFYVYLASWVFFLLIEMLTVTFYGLSVSLACFLLALYVYITGDTTITVAQGLIFAILSALSAYFLPKYLTSNAKMLKSGLEAHMGQSFRLERVGGDWKVKIDGVDFLIDENYVTPEFEVGKKVRLDGHDAGVLKVSLVK